MKIYKIASANTGVRLDRFLAKQLPEATRSWLQKLIKQAKVRVNDTTVKAHYLLKAGEVVAIDYQPPSPLKITANALVSFRVIDENKDWLVLEKPAGLVVHQSLSHREPNTLVNGLLAKYPEIRGVGEGEIRSGLVHRLDRDVSGVMVAAKTPAAYGKLKEQFKKRSVSKTYLALAHGQLSKNEETINLSIQRSKRHGQKMAVQPKGSGQGKEAITRYHVIKQYAKHALVKINIITGRTHQIRAHFAAIGHPVVGDQLYKQSRYKNGQFTRLMLHAVELCLTIPSGERRCWRSEWPIDLQKQIDSLT